MNAFDQALTVACEISHLVARVVGAILIACGVVLLVGSLLGILANIGGADINGSLILWSFIGGKVALVIGYILFPE